MNEIQLSILVFGVGTLLQFFTMMPQFILRPQWDQWRFFLLGVFLGIPLIFHIILRRSDGDVTFAFWGAVCIMLSFLLVTYRKELLPRISSYELLILNVIMLFILSDQIALTHPLFIIILIPSTIILINMFFDFGHSRFARIFFFSWFCALASAIGFSYFTSSELSELLFIAEQKPTLDFMRIAVSGAAFMYIFTMAWYILAVIPIPNKHDLISVTFRKMREHLDLISEGYLIPTGHRWRRIFSLVLFTILIAVYYFSNLMSLFTLTSFGLALISFFHSGPTRKIS